MLSNLISKSRTSNSDSNCYTISHDFVHWYEICATNKLSALQRKLVYNRGQLTGKSVARLAGTENTLHQRISQKHSGEQFVADICKQLTLIPTIFIKLQPNVANKQTNLRISSNSISQPARLLVYHKQITKAASTALSFSNLETEVRILSLPVTMIICIYAFNALSCSSSTIFLKFIRRLSYLIPLSQ